MTTPVRPNRLPKLTRRGLMTGGGAGLGLVIAWSLWPRTYPATLALAPDEAGLGGYLKIGTDNVITIVSPEVEMGQGNTTLFAQILADELGADWQTIGLEPAQPHPLYALGAPPDWPILSPTLVDRARGVVPVQITSEAFAPARLEPVAREAGARARSLLCKAAARQWQADWRACDTADGFVMLGTRKLRFGALALAAAEEILDEPPVLRPANSQRLARTTPPRLDIPAKSMGG